MMRLALIILAVIAIGACSTNNTQYGSFVTNTVGLNEQIIVDDVIEQLKDHYPPAKTHLALKQLTPDTFGITFTNSLRQEGYAVAEYDENQRSLAGLVPLRYIFDELKDSSHYRLTLYVGANAFSRPYTIEQGAVVPSGLWVRKEPYNE